MRRAPLRGQGRRLSVLEARHGLEPFQDLPVSQWPDWALEAEVAYYLSELEGRSVSPEEVAAFSDDELARRVGIAE